MYKIIQNNTDSEKKLMTVKEFGEEYGIGLNSAYKMVKEQYAPIIKVGNRILLVRSMVDLWIKNKVIESDEKIIRGDRNVINN